MRIRELEEEGFGGYDSDEIETMSTKRVLVGLGARVLFYPTLMYNVLRNKIQSEFRWWDEVDQYLLLGAVPFQTDVLRLQKLGVKGVVTLNEPYETLVPSSLYKAHGIDHLVIPTRDYFFAPSLINISRAVDFIHRNASCGSTTYVHCKAGRGRSTTIVLCYLIEYKNMTPADALEYVHSRRPRILLTPSQWQAVQEYSKRRSEFPALQSCSQKSIQVDDTVLITEADLEGYATSEDCFEDHMILLNSEKVIPAEISPAGSLLEDEVLITEKDLEGYDSSSSDKGSDDKRPSLFGISSSRSKISKLSCLFSSLKFSSSSSPSASSRVQEIRAC